MSRFRTRISLLAGISDLNGERMEGESGHDPSQTHAMVLEGRIQLSSTGWLFQASLPYIQSRYKARIRTGSWALAHRRSGIMGPTAPSGTFPDFRFGVRYNLTHRPLAITPLSER